MVLIASCMLYLANPMDMKLVSSYNVDHKEMNTGSTTFISDFLHKGETSKDLDVW